MSWRALISELTFLQQLTMCFAFSGNPGLAAEAHRLGLRLGDKFLPFSNAEEILLDLSDHLQGLGGTVQ